MSCCGVPTSTSSPEVFPHSAAMLKLSEQAASLLHCTSMSSVTPAAAGRFYTAQLQRAHIASGCLTRCKPATPSQQ